MTEALENDDYTLFNSDTSITSKLLTKKQLFFNMCQAMIPKTTLSPLAASTLIFISFIQLIAFEFGPDFTSSSNIVELILDNTRLYYEIETVKSPLLYFCTLAIVFIALMVITLSIIIKYIFPLSPFLSYMSYSTPFIFWVGLLPITELLLSLYQCNDNGDQIVLGIKCWGMLHLALAFLASVAIFMWIVIVFVIIVAMSYSQPHKQDPFGHFPWNFEAFYTIIRVMYCLYFKFEMLQYFKIPLIIITLPYFCSVLWDSYPYYHPTVSYTFSVGILYNVVGLLVAALNFCYDFLNFDNKNLIGISVASFFLVPFLVNLSQKRWYKFLLTRNAITSVLEIDAKIHILRNIFLEGVRYIDGQDEILAMIYYGDQSDDRRSPQILELNNYSALMNSNSTDDNKLLGNKCKMLSLIARYDINDSSSVQFIIRMSGVYLSLITNAYMSYKLLLEAEKHDSGLLPQFAIFLQKNDIFSAVESQNRKAERKFAYSKFQKVIQFESEFKGLRNKMIEQAKMRIDFWTNLKANPNLNRLHTLGLDFIKLNLDIRKSWNILIDLNSQHILSLKLFRGYVKNILGDLEESTQLERKIQLEAFERGWRTLCLGEIFSDHVSIVVISGDEAKILRASKSIVNFFSYEQKELTGRSIQMLMPPIIGAHHKRFMDNFYRNETNRIAGKQFHSFALNRNGYIIPIRLAIQPFFSLSMGLLYVGAIQVEPKYNEDNYVIADCTGKIGGITASFSRTLQLTPAMISERKLYLQNICPDLLEGDIRTLEGSMTLKFVATMCSVGINRSKGFRGSYMERSEVMCVVKCEVNTVKYSSGLALKIFKIGKNISQSVDGKKKQGMIGYEVVASINAILRAFRKIKGIVSRARQKRLLSVKRNRLSLEPIPGNLLSYENSPQQEEEKEATDPQSSAKEGAPASPGKTKRKLSGRQLMRPTSKQNKKMSTNKLREAFNQMMSSQVPSSTNSGLLKKTSLDSEKESTTRSVTSGRILKEISDYRKKDQDSTHTKPIINYMKVATHFFIALILILVSVRVGISIAINKQAIDLSPILLAHEDRVGYSGDLATCAEMLTLHFPFGEQNYTIVEDITKDSRYDFKYLAKQIDPTTQVNNYYSYMLLRARTAINTLKTLQSNIGGLINSYGESDLNVLDDLVIELTYNMKGKFFNTSMSLFDGLYTLIATALDLLDEVESNKYTSRSYTGAFVINNLLTGVPKASKPTLDYIITKGYSKIELHSEFSISAYICLMGLYAVYFFVLIPFLYLTNKNLVSMLMPFLDISRQDIIDQLDKAMRFLKKLYKSEKIRQKEIAVDANGQDEGEQNEKDNSPQGGKEENESEDEGYKKDTKENVRSKKSLTNKVRSYMEYKSNIWKLMFLFGVFSSFVVIVYFLLDYFSKSVTSQNNFKMSEIKSFGRSTGANMYLISYMYNYIMSNKTAICSSSPCEGYIQKFYEGRLDELNTLLLYHKSNVSQVSKEYDNLFVDVLEKNACKIPYLGNITNCTTMLGGIFTNGVHATSIAMLDLAMSVFRDFQGSKGNWSDIIQYINDPRLIDIDVMNNLLINPALNMMIAYVSNVLKDDYNTGVILISCLFVVFVVTFIFISIVWLNWVLNFMEHAIFGTKSILSSLPDDIILKNQGIYKHLLDDNDTDYNS